MFSGIGSVLYVLRGGDVQRQGSRHCGATTIRPLSALDESKRNRKRNNIDKRDNGYFCAKFPFGINDNATITLQHAVFVSTMYLSQLGGALPRLRVYAVRCILYCAWAEV